MSPRASAVAADRRDTPRSENRSEAPDAAFQDAIDAARVSSEETRPPANASDTPIWSANDNAADVVLAAAPDVSLQRRQQLAEWVERQSDPSGGFLGIGQTSTTEKVIGALRGQSELGALDQQQQRLLMDRMLDRWTAGRGEGPGGAARLSRSLGDAPELRAVVAERTALEAAELARDPAIATARSGEEWQRRMTAASYAVSAITAVSGPAGSAPARSRAATEHAERAAARGCGRLRACALDRCIGGLRRTDDCVDARARIGGAQSGTSVGSSERVRAERFRPNIGDRLQRRAGPAPDDGARARTRVVSR
ncbi:hypothetical protein ACF1BQ_005480 [Bradyrhizobium sp. RDT10]